MNFLEHTNSLQFAKENNQLIALLLQGEHKSFVDTAGNFDVDLFNMNYPGGLDNYKVAIDSCLGSFHHYFKYYSSISGLSESDTFNRSIAKNQLDCDISGVSDW